MCTSGKFASKSPNKSVNQLKLAATKKSKKGGTLNKKLILAPFYCDLLGDC